MDIVFLAIVGNSIVEVNDAIGGASSVPGAGVFSVAMASINMFVKLGYVAVGYQLFLSWGGMTAAQAPITPQGAPSGGAVPPAIAGMSGAGDAYASMPPSGDTPTGYDASASGYGMPPTTGYAAAPSAGGGYTVPDGSGYGGPGTGYGNPKVEPTGGVESYQSA